MKAAFVRLPATVQGILCMSLSYALLACSDAAAKWLSQSHHITDLMVYRGLVTLLPLAIMARARGGIAATFRSRAPGLLALRTAATMACTVFVLMSFKLMPLADALAIIFASPLLIAALAGPMLGERVSPKLWAALAFGFCGVLLIVRPGGASFEPLMLVFPLLAALTAALRDILTRKLAPYDSPTTVLLYAQVSAIAAGCLAMPYFGTLPPTLGDVWLFVGSALLMTASQWLTIKALHLAPAAKVTPFRYLSLVFAALLGWLVWGDLPDLWKVAGAVLVVMAGLYILRMETSRRPA